MRRTLGLISIITKQNKTKQNKTKTPNQKINKATTKSQSTKTTQSLSLYCSDPPMSPQQDLPYIVTDAGLGSLPGTVLLCCSVTWAKAAFILSPFIELCISNQLGID
jgi:hypothetical protein